MRDPRRLLDGDASELERSLLGAAQAEAAPLAGQERLLAQLGLSSVAVGLSLPASAHAAGSASLPPAAGAALAGGVHGLLGKLLLGAVIGSLAGTALWLGMPPESAPTPSMKSATAGQPASGPGTPAQGSSSAPATPGTAASAGKTPSALSREVAELAQVRAQLRAGAARAALIALDAYRAGRDRPVLAQEADALRVEALLLAGDKAAARSEGERFLRAHPASPHTARLQALLRAKPAER